MTSKKPKVPDAVRYIKKENKTASEAVMKAACTMREACKKKKS